MNILIKYFFAFFLAVYFLFFNFSNAFAFLAGLETKKERRMREGTAASSSGDLYERIEESFLREDYETALALSERYISTGNAPEADEVSYLAALCLLKLNRAPEAREKLKALAAGAHSDELKGQALVSIGDSYFYSSPGQPDDRAAALQNYEMALKKYPDLGEASSIQHRLSEKPAQAPVPSAPLHQGVTEEAPFYTVQVGSFSKERNARALIQNLSRRRFDVYLDNHAPGGLVRVRVGKCATREESEQLEARLKSEGFSTRIYP